MLESRPTERVLERLRLARPAETPAPMLPEDATPDDWRSAYNDLARQVADLRRQVESPQYGLWVAAMSAATALLLQFAGVGG